MLLCMLIRKQYYKIGGPPSGLKQHKNDFERRSYQGTADLFYRRNHRQGLHGVCNVLL